MLSIFITVLLSTVQLPNTRLPIDQHGDPLVTGELASGLLAQLQMSGLLDPLLGGAVALSTAAATSGAVLKAIKPGEYAAAQTAELARRVCMGQRREEEIRRLETCGEAGLRPRPLPWRHLLLA